MNTDVTSAAQAGVAAVPPVPAPAAGKPVRVLLADDHSIFRQSLCMVLQQEGLEVVGEVADGESALRMAKTLDPDVAILDYSLPGRNGIELAREMQRVAPGTQTILLAMQEDNASAVEALRAGMHGYLYKSQTAADLVATVREVARGAIHFTASVPTISNQAHGAEEGRDPLSQRERQVLILIAAGNTTRAIAQTLGLSVKTVESHRSRIMHKLHVHRAAELIRYAIRRQLITP